MTARQYVYIGLGFVNALLVGAVQQGLVPSHYAQAVALVSFCCAAVMKEFQATQATQPAPAAAPAEPPPAPPAGDA